jgi:hypothetical protein
MHNSSLHVIEYIGPAVGAALFVLGMSLVKEPARRTFNAIFVRCQRCLSERRFWRLGIVVSGDSYAGHISQPRVVSFHRDCMAYARVLGRSTSFLGQSHLAVYADVLRGVRDF